MSESAAAMIDDEDTVTAYHEAGHAAVAWALGARVDSLSLWAGSSYDDDFDGLPRHFGQCRIDWGRVSPAAPDQVMRELLTTLAGPVAEELYVGDDCDQATWAMDMTIARRLVASLSQAQAERVIAATIVHLKRLMDDSLGWPAIAALADEVMLGDPIGGVDVDRVLHFWWPR